jgi:cyclase
VNTEHHVDHTFGNAFLPGTVVAHVKTKEKFWEANVLGGNPLKDPGTYIEMSDPLAGDEAGRYKPREPEISFTRYLTFSLGGVDIDLFPMPGHIEANTAVYVRQDGVLFTSDNVFNEVMTWYQEALPFEWLETLEAFKRMDVEVVVPGHGHADGPQLLERMRAQVDRAIDKIQVAIEHGTSRQNAVESLTLLDDQPIPQDYRSFAPMLQRIFVGRVYDQIMAQFP